MMGTTSYFDECIAKMTFTSVFSILVENLEKSTLSLAMALKINSKKYRGL